MSLHALGSSTLQQLQEESIDHEIQLLTSDKFIKGLNNGINFQDYILYSNESYFLCFVIGYMGLQYLYGSGSKLSKLNNIDHYIYFRKKWKTALLLFAVLFFRNVENAI